jgi:hypothetical protein
MCGPGGAGLELSCLCRLGRPRVCQRQVSTQLQACLRWCSPQAQHARPAAPVATPAPNTPLFPTPTLDVLYCRVARDHGISSVGLPSRLASFKALPLPALAGSQQNQQGQQQQQKSSSKHSSWWDLPHRRSSRGGGSGDAAAAGSGTPTASLELSNSEGGRLRRGLGSAVCCIEMPQLAPAWAPKIQMFLPSLRWAACCVCCPSCCCGRHVTAAPVKRLLSPLLRLCGAEGVFGIRQGALFLLVSHFALHPASCLHLCPGCSSMLCPPLLPLLPADCLLTAPFPTAAVL